MAYVQLVQGCTRSYADDISNMPKLMSDAWTRFNTRSIGHISLGVYCLGIPEDMIEWGMRKIRPLYQRITNFWSLTVLPGFYTGAGGAHKDVEIALALWEHITNPKEDPLYPRLSHTPSRRILATAYSLQANVYRERAFAEKESLQIDDLLRAARAANASAALGFITPIVLVLASFIDGPFGPRGDGSLRELPQFADLKDMWAAWTHRQGEVEMERLARDEKVLRAPNTYICAAEGCGIQGLTKSALLRCGGRCEGAHKPHYCSKECQRKVRDLSGDHSHTLFTATFSGLEAAQTVV